MKKLLATLLSFIPLTVVQAQVDAHFSQYYAHPLWMNPAMTGAFDGLVRVSGIYRSQWGQISTPFITSGLSADVVTGKNLNIGASVLNQTAGNAGYRFMNGSVSVAYSGIRFGAEENQQLIIGMQVGFINRRFDPSKFQFGDQWNPSTGFDPNTPSADQLTKTTASSFDAGAGIAWLDRTPEKQAAPYIGFSMTHLTQPYDPFASGAKSYLPFRYTVHGGARIKLSDNTSLTPNFLYMRQGNADEKMIGAAAGIYVNENTDVIFGVNYRVQDALSPFAGMRYQNFTLGVSYDNNMSNLGRMAGHTGGFELSLSYIAPRSEYKGIPCPKF